MEEQREVKAEERWGQSIRLHHGDPAKGLWPGDIDIEKEEVLQLHAEIGESFRMSVKKAIRIGELLTSIKQRIGHGQWGSWVEENLPFSQRSAERYMALTAVQIKIDSLSHLGLFDAYKLLPHKLRHDSKVKSGTTFRLTKDGYIPVEELEPEAETPGAIEMPESEIVEAEESDESDETIPEVEPDEAVQDEVVQLATEKRFHAVAEKVEKLEREIGHLTLSLRGYTRGDLNVSSLKLRIVNLLGSLRGLWMVFDEDETVPSLQVVEPDETVESDVEKLRHISDGVVQALEPDQSVQSATVKNLCRIFKAASEEDQLQFLQWTEINYKELWNEALWAD